MIAQSDGSRFEVFEQRGIFIVREFMRGFYGIDTRYDILNVARWHSGQVNILFADGHVGSESLHQMLYPSLDNWTRFNYDNKKHWQDGDMPSAEGWNPKTPWDELVEF